MKDRELISSYALLVQFRKTFNNTVVRGLLLCVKVQLSEATLNPRQNKWITFPL